MNWTNIRKAIIMILAQTEEMSRKQLRVAIPLPRTTMYDNLDVMEKAGYLKFEIKSNGQKGRPITYWSVVKK